MPRLLHVSVAVVTAGLAVAVALVAPAAANASTALIVGDVTGDGIKDRTTLATTGTDARVRCLVVVRVGKADGTFVAAKKMTLPVADNAEDGALQGCPDKGIVLTAAKRSANRLALLYSDPPLAGSRGTQVYDLTGTAVTRGAPTFVTAFALNHLGTFGTADFDGDGNADFWQQGTDEGDGSAFWQRRGDTFVQIYDTGYNPGVYEPGSGLQFVDLNHAGGTDALASTITTGDPAFAAVVDGRTGAVQVLAQGSPTTGPYIRGYRITTVDLDHDAYPDIAVTPLTDDGTLPVRYFLNRSQGGHWSFTAHAGP